MLLSDFDPCDAAEHIATQMHLTPGPFVMTTTGPVHIDDILPQSAAVMDANEEHVAISKTRTGKQMQGNSREVGRGKPPVEHRFELGQSGNPAGKMPGTVSLRAILKAQLAEVPEGKDRRTLAEQLVDQTCKAAMRGDAQARKLIWESLEGTARRQIDVTAHEYVPPVEGYVDLSALTDEELNAEILQIVEGLLASSSPLNRGDLAAYPRVKTFLCGTRPTDLPGL